MRFYLALFGVLVQASASCSTTEVPAPVSLSVKLTIEGAGSVMSEPLGIDCTGPSDCGTTKIAGSSVKLTAKPTPGSLLSSWTVDGKSAGNATSISVERDTGETRVVTVAFARGPALDAGIEDRDAGSKLDSAIVEAGSDAASESDPYFAVCYSRLLGKVGSGLRFLADVAVSADGGRQLDLKLGALKSTARTVSRSEVSGAPLVFPSTNLVGPLDSFMHSLSTATVNGAANPLSGRDITLQPLNQTGQFAPSEFCTNLTGTIVIPIVADYQAVCLYRRMPEGTPFIISADETSLTVLGRTLTAASFTCPLGGP
jgi:hypothetical protein